MLKVLVACGNGMGSSVLIGIKVGNVLTRLGVTYTLDHSSVGDAKSRASEYDAVFCSTAFVPEFADAAKKGTKIIGIKNLLSEKEIEEGYKANFD